MRFHFFTKIKGCDDFRDVFVIEAHNREKAMECLIDNDFLDSLTRYHDLVVRDKEIYYEAYPTLPKMRQYEVDDYIPSVESYYHQLYNEDEVDQEWVLRKAYFLALYIRYSPENFISFSEGTLTQEVKWLLAPEQDYLYRKYAMKGDSKPVVLK